MLSQRYWQHDLADSLEAGAFSRENFQNDG